jgi:cytidine deaminase
MTTPSWFVSKDNLLPSLVFGFSCGAGYFVAKECWERNTLNWMNLSKFTVSVVQCQVPLWIVAFGHRGWLPIAICYFLKDIFAENLTFIQSDNHSNKTENEASSDSSTKQSSGIVQQIVPTPPPSTLDKTNPSSNNLQQRYLEMLVHNVSHTDLVMGLDPNDGIPDYCLCRPRFSAFDLYARRILKSLPQKVEIVSFPRYERSDDDPRHKIITPKVSRQKMLPTGFQLDANDLELAVRQNDRLDLRFRGRDVPRIEAILSKEKYADKTLRLNNVFFPLLAALLPRWRKQIASNCSSQSEVKKVLILVTGVGSPRNWTHSVDGNSTEACAELMERFVHLLYPDVKVVRIHSSTNIFRYDENILFAKRELKPLVDAYRDAHARGQPYPDEIKLPKDLSVKPFSSEWKRSFNVTLSFADGSPARVHAIQMALRPYKPNYLHFWQLKSFWHDTKIVDDDIEMHSFEEMETVPAFDASDIADYNTQLVIKEMKSFRQEFLTLLEGKNDVEQFWLRKSKKPVLAVLLVQSSNHAKPILYRGTNMEVSMPTGSLCAERNVIGTALASNPGLKREDLKMVAVLAVPLPTRIPESRMGTMSRNMSFASFSSVVVMEDPDLMANDWIIPNENTNEAPSHGRQSSLDRPVLEHVTAISESTKLSSSSPIPQGMIISATPPGTPVRRIPLYSNTRATTTDSLVKPTMRGVGGRKPKRNVLVHCENDLNPLRPCGSCNEWLKKIAESNPYFVVVTFTDAECAGVYCTPCEE